MCPVDHLSSQECDLAYFHTCFNSVDLRSGVGAGVERAGEVPHPAAVREPGGDGGQVPAGQPARTQPSQRRPQGSSPRHQLHTRQINKKNSKIMEFIFELK